MANFQLILAINPCPCGYHGSTKDPAPVQQQLGPKCQKCISGPLLDRIDIRIEVPSVDYEKFT